MSKKTKSQAEKNYHEHIARPARNTWHNYDLPNHASAKAKNEPTRQMGETSSGIAVSSLCR